MEESRNDKVNQAHVLFDRFVQATTCKGTMKSFQELCDYLELKPRDYRTFYHKLKSKLNYWKAKALWSKIDKRGCHKDYKKGKACTNTKCLIIGAGPCGLRTAIELCLLGAKVVVVEKRDAFSRNNVLHLWPFTIHDLRSLGAKKFHGKFCAGAIDHISIRQLQLILLKVSLILGIEIHVNVEFQGLIEPPESQENERVGWRAKVHPSTHPVSEFDFDVIIGADGRRNTLAGFRRKEFRGKLAIAITANFINRNTTAEAKVEEISGVAFIFNQKFFQDLREATGIDLENIVYYKDDTHYFVMTAKKQSLLEKGVILQDYADTELLLSRANVDQEALLNYATEAAKFSTNQQLPSLDFAINHYGQPDVAMFDFTCMYASENAALVRERNGHRLLVALVGDSLLEPFWPMGTGIARGFLAAMDSAWMVRSWSQGASPMEVLAERESIYRLLPQTTPENVNKNFNQYSIDPTTRYPNVNLQFLRPSQVRHLYNTSELKDVTLEISNLVNSRTPKLGRNESVARSSKLLGWCQKQTEGYACVNVTDLTMSWKSGLALSAIIHRYRPELIDFDSLDEHNVERNNQLAFDIAERELGISPIMTGKEMASVGEPDKLSMVVYLSQFYEMFKETTNSEDADHNPDEKAALLSSTKSPISFLSKLGQTISRKRTPKDKKEKDVDSSGKRRKTSQSEDEEAPKSLREERPSPVSTLTERRIDAAIGNQNKVKSMATQLLAKFEENAPAPNAGLRKQTSFRKEFPQNIGGSDVCYFCRRRVYVMERLSAEAKFFHRSCFKCDYCNTTLRLSCYAYDLEDGKFYCKPHYCYRRSGYGHRKRPAAPSLQPKENKGIAKDTPDAEDTGRVPSLPPIAAEKTPGSSMNGVEDHSLAKRLRATPERIELENYRVSLREELEEVPEETLAEHNLSSLLDQGREEEEAISSSSESEMEEEDEDEQDEIEDNLPSSDLGGVPWREAVKIHAKLKGKSPEDLEGQGALVIGDIEYEEEEYENEEEEEDEEEGVSSEVSSAVALKLPSHHHDPVRAWLESVSGAACEDEEEEELGTGPAEAEAGVDGDTSADLGDDDDIPSDAEAEERIQQSGRLKLNLDEEPSVEQTTQRDPNKVSSLVALTPDRKVLSPVAQSPREEKEKVPVTRPQEVKSPGNRFFLDPFVPEDTNNTVTPSAVLKKRSPLSPVCSQPIASQEPALPMSPVKTPSNLPLTQPLRSPTSPICSQPLPSTEVTITTPAKSPVCLQPSPITSTPLSKLPLTDHIEEDDKLTSPSTEEALKRIDLIEEFWMKSAEIRRSLGLTPVERGRRHEVSFPAFESTTPQSHVPKPNPEEELISLSMKSQLITKKLNPNRLDVELLSPLTPISPTEKELKSSDGERKDISTSSGLGLNGSNSNTRTVASESFNTSDSAMLTPPSSPPPPPPQGEEPATLRRNRTSWQNGPESVPTPAQEKAKSPDTPQPTPRIEEVRKSFVESVDEIPFADDVEDTYDDRTENSSFQEKYYTPPTSHVKSHRKGLAKENGELSSSTERGHHRKRILPQVTPEAKERAEERMREREKSVKSRALRDAMAQQLDKMRQLEIAASERTSKGQFFQSTILANELSQLPNTGVKSETPTLKLETAHEVFLSPQPADGSVTSSEGSGGKPKKRPSLFSPRKKEKKSKGEGSRLSDKHDDGVKPKSIWKSVFSGYKKEKKKKISEDKSSPSTPSSSTTVDSGKAKVANMARGADLVLRRHLSFSEDSDLSSDDVLEKSSQKSKRESVYVPHALAFRRSYSSKKAYTDEELNAKLTRRVQKAARRQAKQEELKRLHRAQIIQRQLEQVEEKQRQLEERGVAVEKALRGEAGMGKKDDPKLMQEWFRLVQEKNSLVRYESELMIFARELELEDRQSRLQQELRERMAVEDNLKTEQELADEKKILNEMLDVVEQRDALVALLEEQRLREKEEDKDLEEVMLSKGYNLNWS
ncbi:-methionine sulfoxide oxidase MICAL3 isoform X3 [Pelobates cultripes]|uniref:F-actin monooxygenase n=1 Tax=Pelobates cultripes TaxID=61616 RepID=A0AAD1RQV7_PELCU|nr:-methionine sulfoxide oxidase MICAL3 isoform X3 [Pelobates cultripes]